MRAALLVLCCNFLLSVSAQTLSWSPAFPLATDNISITMDATKGNLGLFNYTPASDVYVHTGVITNLSTTSGDWKYVKFNQAFNQTNPSLQATSLGNNLWKFDITNIRAYYGVPANETILKIAILFRSGNGSAVQRNTDGSDMYIPIYTSTVATRFTNPPFQPTYTPQPEPINKQVGETIALTAIANGTADNMKLYLNGSVIQTATNTATISATPTLTTAGAQTIVSEATKFGSTRTDTLRFFVANAPNVAALPAGVRDGINYEAGNTSVVLVLNAPGKNRVSVIGDFPGSNWQEQTNYVMSKTPDGNYWWIRINGLTPGTEYGFQYLVDGALRVGDPYAEKVLDPWNDASIPSTTYPNPKPYPTGQTTGLVSVFQTNAPAYNWRVNNFTRPDKKSLVIYEMLLRDFTAAHDWRSLRDTISYFKRLGVNAIEIMPFNEFDGNESWGYNPSYFLAPDKYYGTKNMLKEFVDTCHANGIAVIMDIALNHTTGANPLAALYWNAATNAPAANNPWLNQAATHPFSVFNDFNHESLRTRYFTSRVVEHWLKEYKLDGFRFDLSKGFTQTNSGTNVGTWSGYDASRIAIWKRYYDTCQLKAPGSYVILEHFADNNEEIELSNYGMLLWGNNVTQYEEAAMGFVSNSNFEGNLFTVRNWSQPHLIGYMESHDEERLMYKNLQFGNTSGGYNVKDLNTALKRVELTGAFFYMMPGPKMLWQFGELGYDYSINYCPDGTVNAACRTSNKPIRWDYQSVVNRQRVYDVFGALNKLRAHPWFKNNFTSNRIGRSLGGSFKWLQVTTDTSNICVVGNFDVTQQTGTVTFQNAGTWYNYLTGETFSATGSAQSITLQPGEYRVYVNRNVVSQIVTATPATPNTSVGYTARLFPQPSSDQTWLELNMPRSGQVQAQLIDGSGVVLRSLVDRRFNAGVHRISLQESVRSLPTGSYWVRLQTPEGIRTLRLVRIR
ncbi:MAG: alpha-amylase family glycosyl hydrolase [Bacteroidota bacterium]